MSSGMPELGSKISLISKADIRYEGRLFTVDPQECTIALASVRSFGTEDRETQYPVAPQSQVYDYILFRGSDIKDIRVMNNLPSLPNDPAIMQMSVPPTLGTGASPGQFAGQFNHPIVGQQYPQYHPMSGFPGGVHAPLNKTSELSPQTVELAPQPQPSAAPIGSGVAHHAKQVKDQGSMLDLIGSQQSTSRSATPAMGHRKSPTADQGTQVGSVAGGSGQQRRGSGGAGPGGKQAAGAGPGAAAGRTSSRTRSRHASGSAPAHQQHQQHPPQQPHQQQQQQHPHQPYQNHNAQQHHHQAGQGYNRGGWRGRARGRGRGFAPRNKNTLKFDNDYDFEQANTEFEELRSQLAKAKIADGDGKPDVNMVEDRQMVQLMTAENQTVPLVVGEVDKKDDSGNETGAGEAEQDDDYTPYDKTKSFFDNISCEAVERSKGRSQRTDWRTERKLNSETFGVASARRGAWRGRGGWRHSAHAQHGPHNAHNAHSQHNAHNAHNQHQPSWRPMRGGRGARGGPGPRPRAQPAPPAPAPPAAAAAQQPVAATPAPAAAAAAAN